MSICREEKKIQRNLTFVILVSQKAIVTTEIMTCLICISDVSAGINTLCNIIFTYRFIPKLSNNKVICNNDVIEFLDEE